MNQAYRANCPYLEDYGRYHICRAKGASPPSYNERMQFCFKHYTHCPSYQTKMNRLRQQGKDSV